jgi:uncharacterized iron-regulated membrane protein
MPVSPTAARWPDYRAVWRWHFYAGLFCIPFVAVLAISGAIYLFKAEIEGWAERPYDTLDPAADPAPPSAHVSGARPPGHRPHRRRLEAGLRRPDVAGDPRERP